MLKPSPVKVNQLRLKADVSNLAAAIDAGWSMKVELLFNGQTTVKDGAANSGSTTIALTKPLPAAPLVFQDPIQYVEFSTRVHAQLSVNGDGAPVSINEMPILSYDPDKHSYTVLSGQTDRGTSYTAQYVMDSCLCSDKATIVVKFMTNEEYFRNSGGEPKVRYLPLDLSILEPSLRGRTVEQLIAYSDIPAAGSFDGYQFYRSAPEKETANFTRQLTTFAHGLNEAERFFGRKQGSLVKSFHYIPAANDQAYSLGSGRITVTKGSLRTSDAEIRLTAIHETAHEFDAAVSFSQRFLANLHERIKQLHPGMFQRLNEQEFIGNTVAGHSQDNPSELFASFTASLFAPNWQQAIDRLTLPEKRMYARVAYSALEGVNTCINEGSLDVRSSFAQRVKSVYAKVENYLPDPYRAGKATAAQLEERLQFDRYDLKRALQAGYSAEVHGANSAYVDGMSPSATTLKITAENLGRPFSFSEDISSIVFRKKVDATWEYVNDKPFAVNCEHVKYIDSTTNGAVVEFLEHENGQKSWREYTKAKDGSTTLSVIMEFPQGHAQRALQTPGTAPAMRVDLSALGPEFRHKTVEAQFQFQRSYPAARVGGFNVVETLPAAAQRGYSQDGLAGILRQYSSYAARFHLPAAPVSKIVVKGSGDAGALFLSDDAIIVDRRDLVASAKLPESEASLLFCRVLRDKRTKPLTETERVYHRLERSAPRMLGMVDPKNTHGSGRGGYSAQGADRLFAATLNSTLAPNWSRFIARLDFRQKQIYSEMLVAVADDIRSGLLAQYGRDALLAHLGQCLQTLRQARTR